MKDALCSVCGSDNFVQKTKGKLYCSRHRSQLNRSGKILRITIKDRNELIIKKSYAEIILRDIRHKEVGRAVIDLEDINKVKKHKWGLDVEGYASSYHSRLHRFLFKKRYKPGEQIDHVNKNKLDNRKKNLRIVNNSLNSFNKEKLVRNISGIVGVHFNKKTKNWIAQIGVNYKTIHLGSFKNINKARLVREKAELKYFGEKLDPYYCSGCIEELGQAIMYQDDEGLYFATSIDDYMEFEEMEHFMICMVNDDGEVIVW